MLRRIVETPQYRDWFTSLRDDRGRDRIAIRIRRLADGNPGIHRSLSRGLRALKIDVGPGYRVYYVERGGCVILLLAGGDKSTQKVDIEVAISLMDNYTEPA